MSAPLYLITMEFLRLHECTVKQWMTVLYVVVAEPVSKDEINLKHIQIQKCQNTTNMSGSIGGYSHK